jgi:hypothetical protein
MPTAQGHYPVRRKSIGKDGDNALLYQLQPSVTSVKLSGGAYSVSSITCKLRKIDGSTMSVVTSLPSGYSMKSKIDSGSEASYTINTALTITSATESVTFSLYYGSTLAESLTIPIVADGKQGSDGIINDYRGEWDETTEYRYDTKVRHFVSHGGYFFGVLTQGAVLKGVEPNTSISDGDNDGNWQKSSDFKFITADTAIIDGGNIGGFSFSRKKNADGTDKMVNGNIVGVMKSQASDSNGDSILSLDSETGKITAKAATLEGATIKDGTFKVTSGVTTVEISTVSQGMKIFEGETEKTSFTAAEKTKSSLYQTSTSSGTIKVNTNYNYQRIPLSSDSSGLIYPTRQGSMMNSVDLLENSTTSTFTISSKSRVRFGDGSTSFLTMYFTKPSGIDASQFYSCIEVEITDTTGNTKYYYQDYYTNYQTGENDDTASVSVSSFYVTLDAGTYKMAVNSTMYANVVDKLTSDGQLYVGLSNISWSADPQIYNSDFFGNGLAIGTSSNHHFLTINENDVQTSEMISGDAGIKVSNGVLKLKINGNWYSLGVNGSAITLTATSE